MSNRFQVRKQLHSKIANSKCQIPSPHYSLRTGSFLFSSVTLVFGLEKKKKKKPHKPAGWRDNERSSLALEKRRLSVLVTLLFVSFSSEHLVLYQGIQQFLSRLEEFSKVEVEDWKSFWFFLVSFRWVPFGCKVVGICKGDYWCPLLEEGIYVSWESSFCLQ